MKNIYQFLSLILFASLTSCGEDFFQSTVAIELPEHVAQLAVSGSITEGNEDVSFHITSSKSLNDEGELEVYPDATVQLFKDGNLIAEPIFNAASGLHESTVNATDLQAGNTYRLEVTQAGFDKASAEQKMPAITLIEDSKFEAEGTFDEFGDTADELILEFTDDPNEENYYMVRGIFEYRYFNGVDTITEQYETDLGSIDPNVVRGFTEAYGSAPMISDATFNGKKYKLSLYSNNSFFGGGDENNRVTVYLISITRERYLYLLSMDRFYQSQDNPFAEPVTVAGNIENGLGSFGAQTLDSLVIK